MYVQLLSSCAMPCNVLAGSTPGRKATACMSFASRAGVKYLFDMLSWSMCPGPCKSSRDPSWNCRSKRLWMSWTAFAAFVKVGVPIPVSTTPCRIYRYLYVVILDVFSHDQHIVTTRRLFVAYLGFVLSGGNSLAWITPRTVKIRSSISLSSPRFTILHDAGFENCCILFESQKFAFSMIFGQMFVVMLCEVFSYSAYICQADMFLIAGCLYSDLLKLVA